MEKKPDKKPQSAFTIQQFCEDHSFSKNMFYKLKRAGLAPKMIAVGARRIITVEAAMEWRHTMTSRQEVKEIQK